MVSVMATTTEILKAQRADYLLAKALEWLRLMGPCDMADGFLAAAVAALKEG